MGINKESFGLEPTPEEIKESKLLKEKIKNLRLQGFFDQGLQEDTDGRQRKPLYDGRGLS